MFRNQGDKDTDDQYFDEQAEKEKIRANINYIDKNMNEKIMINSVEGDLF